MANVKPLSKINVRFNFTDDLIRKIENQLKPGNEYLIEQEINESEALERRIQKRRHDENLRIIQARAKTASTSTKNKYKNAIVDIKGLDRLMVEQESVSPEIKIAKKREELQKLLKYLKDRVQNYKDITEIYSKELKNTVHYNYDTERTFLNDLINLNDEIDFRRLKDKQISSVLVILANNLRSAGPSSILPNYVDIEKSDDIFTALYYLFENLMLPKHYRYIPNDDLELSKLKGYITEEDIAGFKKLDMGVSIDKSDYIVEIFEALSNKDKYFMDLKNNGGIDIEIADNAILRYCAWCRVTFYFIDMLALSQASNPAEFINAKIQNERIVKLITETGALTIISDVKEVNPFPDYALLLAMYSPSKLEPAQFMSDNNLNEILQSHGLY